MRNKKILNTEGFTLLEMMLTLFISSLLVFIYITLNSQSITYWQENIEKIRINENLQYSLHYIEKNLRQFDQQHIEYFPELLQLKSENSQGQTSYMDFSGRIIYTRNTYLYYHAGNRQLRVNRNTEHNVLARDIDQVNVREIIPGTIIEVSLSTFDKQGVEHTLKSTIRIGSRR
jgi:prepilin-type N-terminal cleavage/methylation domain-containing protein